MKYLPIRSATRAAALAVAIPAILLAVISLPSPPDRPPAPPRIVAAARGSGSLSAGAAEVRFRLPDGVPIAGFSRLSYASEGGPEPVGARALVLSSAGCTVAVVSAEVLLVSEGLDAEVRERVADLHLSGLVFLATHTHAGPGAYLHDRVFERFATGAYDARAREAIAAAAEEAIRRAAASLVPARVSIARGAAEDLARSRSDGLEDAPLTVVRLERLDGASVAEVTVFAAHPTLLGKRNRTISGDWPSRFVAGGTHGLRLLLQGAVGDQSADGPSENGMGAFAAALSDRVDTLTFGAPDAAPVLAFAAAEVGLPAFDPGGAPAVLRRAARNVAARAFPRGEVLHYAGGATARVVAVRIGPALLVAVPGEPVAAVGAGWRSALGGEAIIVSLAGGYVGYVEAPDRMGAGAGETERTYYGPELAARLGAAARAACDATADVAGGAVGAAPGMAR